MPGFKRDQINVFLAHHGYTVDPEGLTEFFQHDFVQESETVSYLDINAIAVRRGDEVPDRPLRMTFHKVSKGSLFRWTLESVEELAPGVETKALDREAETPKFSPWLDKNLEPGGTCECGSVLQALERFKWLRCESCGKQFPWLGKKPQFPVPPGERF
jgi:hypothetical protein